MTKNKSIRDTLSLIPKVKSISYSESEFRSQFNNHIELSDFNIEGKVENINYQYKLIKNIKKNENEKAHKLVFFIIFAFIIGNLSKKAILAFFLLDKKTLDNVFNYALLELKDRDYKIDLVISFNEFCKNINKYDSNSCISDEAFRNFFDERVVEVEKPINNHSNLIRAFENATGYRVN